MSRLIFCAFTIQDFDHWDVVEALPSYGRGIEAQYGRYRSLISGNNLTDVVITGKESFIKWFIVLHSSLFYLYATCLFLNNSAGNNGTIDGQGSIWWEKFNSHSLNYTRPHLVEFVSSRNVVISNLTLLNAPGWNIRPAYCR